MTDFSTDTIDSAGQGRLRTIIERVERLEEDKAAIMADIKEVYDEAKGEGFDVKILRKVVAIRKKDRAIRSYEATISSLRAEIEKLKAEADPDALVIAHMHGAQMATEKHREEIAKLKAERDEALKTRDSQRKKRWGESGLKLSRETPHTSQLEQAERVIKPFARQAKSYEPDEGDGNHLAWDLGNVVTIGELRAASQWIKDRQATLSKGITE